MNDGEPGAGTPSGASPGGRSSIRVAVLDENDASRAAFAEWVGRNAPDLRVAVEARSWPELVQSAAFPTDVVILDLEPVGPVSIEARIRSCRAAGAIVVALGADDSPENRAHAVELGAVFVARTASFAEAADAVRDAAGVVDEAESWRPRPVVADGDRPRLSPGELHALRLYASGLSLSLIHI